MIYIVMMVFFVGMMFYMTRTQKKQQEQQQQALDALTIGDPIVTIGGLHGVISEIDQENKTIFIDCEGIVLEFDRSAVRPDKNRVAKVADAQTENVEELVAPTATDDVASQTKEEQE